MPNPSTSLRDYRPTDLEACLAVFDSNVGDSFAAAERAEFVQFLGNLPGPYWVLEDEDGRVVGCGGYARREDGVTVDLCWGMVARAHQGQGLGRSLAVERIERVRAEGGVRHVRLATSQLTTGFFERLGFVLENRTPDGFAPGIDCCDMRLDCG